MINYDMNEFDVSIFVVTKKGQYINNDEYDSKEDGSGEFLMITNDRLNPDYGDDSTIFIYNKWKNITERIRIYYGTGHKNGTQWANDSIYTLRSLGMPCIYDTYDDRFLHNPLKIINTELDGYKQTMQTVQYMRDNDTPEQLIGKIIPAVYGSYKQTLQHKGTLWQGYLPSIGQLVYISENLLKIQVISRDAKINILPIHTKTYIGNYNRLGEKWWSSSICDANTIMAFIKGKISTPYKDDRLNVLPLFKMS